MKVSVIFRRVSHNEDGEPELYDRRVIIAGVCDFEYDKAWDSIFDEIDIDEYILNVRFLYDKPSMIDDIKRDEPISSGEYITPDGPKMPVLDAIRDDIERWCAPYTYYNHKVIDKKEVLDIIDKHIKEVKK